MVISERNRHTAVASLPREKATPHSQYANECNSDVDMATEYNVKINVLLLFFSWVYSKLI